MSAIYIIIDNSSKITVMKKQQNNFMVCVWEGGEHNMRNVLEGLSIRKAESHSLRGSSTVLLSCPVPHPGVFSVAAFWCQRYP